MVLTKTLSMQANIAFFTHGCAAVVPCQSFVDPVLLAVRARHANYTIPWATLLNMQKVMIAGIRMTYHLHSTPKANFLIRVLSC